MESLHALVIDHHAGELQPEVAELLESYLVANPAAWAESTRLLTVIEVTRQTVNRHPEVVRAFTPVDPTESPRVKSKATAKAKAKADVMPGWLKMAAMFAFAALTALGGYWVGSDRAEGGPQAVELARATPVTFRKDSPWARYRMETDQVGRIQVVRVDAEAKEGRP